MNNVILENAYNADVAATAVSVVSSNPPSKVDTRPDSFESGIFLVRQARRVARKRNLVGCGGQLSDLGVEVLYTPGKGKC